MTQRQLSIAMLGCRGVPATYGGIERHVEEVGARLADRGHEVTVYCRSDYLEGMRCVTHRGMRTISMPSVHTKHLEALSHTGLAVTRALMQHHDVLHFHALGPGLFTPFGHLSRASATVVTVHGLDFGRAKWGSVAQKLLRRSDRIVAGWAHALVVVAPDLVEHYRSRYGVEATYIRNGVNRPPVVASPPLGRYVLSVGRLTPEKGAHLLISAFRRVEDPDLRLLVVGGSSHTDAYVASLHEAAERDPRVELRGYVYGDDLVRLYVGARLFVQPSSLEGMPLTLLEAAACGVPLLASNLPVHRQVLGVPDKGRRLFAAESLDDLSRQLLMALRTDEDEERRAARAFGEAVLDHWSWDDVVDELEDLYIRTVAVRQRSQGDRPLWRGSRRPTSRPVA